MRPRRRCPGTMFQPVGTAADPSMRGCTASSRRPPFVADRLLIYTRSVRHPLDVSRLVDLALIASA